MTLAKRMILTTSILALAAPARAECMGSCMDGVVGALSAMLIYGVLGLVALVLLIREKWRRGGVKLVLVVALAAVGLPLLSQAWQAWKLRALEAREIVGALPEMDGKVVLMLTESASACYYDLCTLVLLDRGEAGAFVLPISALAGLDTGQPLALADLPLEFWQAPTESSVDPRSRLLSLVERQEAAGRIDYLIVQPGPWNSDLPKAAEAGLRQRPDLAGLKASERVNFAFGPVEGGTLDLAGMSLDLLDLRLEDRALALILAPFNTQDPGNLVANRDALINALCGEGTQARDMDCDYALR